mmetsp:Transcript_8247/g.14170  ORF Transcript_8247/g.14170 Transcript_8247/m.14170 type:complete len:99 (-) Transcript_8247:313-609(-)
MAGKVLSKVELKSLYRKILFQAKIFPSIKRDNLIREIQLEFREKASETDPEKLSSYHDQAVQGLQHLQRYTGFDEANPNWEIEMEKQPLGGKEQDTPS